MRELSLTLREAINAQESGLVPIYLLTLSHEDMVGGPLRISSDPTTLITDVPLVYGTYSRGNLYTFLPLRLQLPSESDDAAPACTLAMSPINQDVIDLARSVTTPGTCIMEVIVHTALDDVEISTPELDIISALLQAGEIQLSLTKNSMANEAFPADSFDPQSFPGLHK